MSKNKTKITGLIACIAILIITVPVGFLTDVFDFEDLKTVGIEFSTILKVIVMAGCRDCCCKPDHHASESS